MPTPFWPRPKRDVIAEESADAGPRPAVHEEHKWVDQMVEKKRVDIKLRSLLETLESQNKELEALMKEAEQDRSTPKLAIGNKASRLLLTAEERARELGHRAVGTGDILWAMLNVGEQENSTAVQFLKGRGVTKDSVYAQHRYSDNASRILQLAAQRSSELNKSVVGTEDLLWAMFQQEEHCHSRSQAVKRLEARGVNMALIWNQAELSRNAQDALKIAVENAKAKGHRTIGSEDLVSALFEVSEATAGHRGGRLLAQHVPPSWHAVHGSDHSSSSSSSGGAGGSSSGSGSSGDGGMGDETLARLFTVGGLAGVIETFMVQPLVYWKTLAQVSPELLFSRQSLRPNIMYQGVFINAASIGPISAFQYASNAALTTLLVNAGAALGGSNSSNSSENSGGGQQLSSSQGLAVAATTGAASAAIVAPAELIMIAQQTTLRSFSHTVHSVGSHAGLRGFYRGVTATAVREAGWTFGFLGLAPQIKHALREDSKIFNRNDVAASLAASVLAGQAAALLTQPADTVKALLQADLAQATTAAAQSAEAAGSSAKVAVGSTGSSRVGPGTGIGIQGNLRFVNSWAAMQHLYRLPQGAGGVAAFWRGIVPRSARCIAACFILGEAQDRLTDLFDHYKWLTAPAAPRPAPTPASSR